MLGSAAQSALHALISIMFGTDMPSPTKLAEIECLAQNIWFETRDGGFEDKLAVGHVVMNRVADERYPDGVCEVIWQPGQFSWTQDGKSDQVRLKNSLDHDAWMESVMAAYLTVRGSMLDMSNGATHYHADYVAPEWRRAMTEVAQYGRHTYYRYSNRPLVGSAHNDRVQPAAGDIEPDLANSDQALSFWSVLMPMLPGVEVR